MSPDAYDVTVYGAPLFSRSRAVLDTHVGDPLSRARVIQWWEYLAGPTDTWIIV